MAKLTEAKRNKLKKSTFGLPSERKYPIPDRSHAINAKARAKQQLDEGNLTKNQYNHIVAKANEALED
jgi:hypothetical protein